LLTCGERRMSKRSHARRQRHRALDDGAGALGGVDDLERPTGRSGL
jgi:hypothetical protein